MEWLASEIGSLLVGAGTGGLKGLWMRFKLSRIKRRLVKNLSSEILKKYGSRVFYNDLDSFLYVNKVITNLLTNCESTPHNEYRSKSLIVSYYIQMFIDKYPSHRTEIDSLIKSCFDIVYITLNDVSGDENARVICNLAKELAGELSFNLNEIKCEVAGMNQKIETLLQQNSKELSEPTILLEQYLDAQTRLYLDMKGTNFIPRALYYKNDDDTPIDALDALLKDKHVLLLGDAGYGKTFESIDILSKVCKSIKTTALVPVYLPLYEYGTLYESIVEGVKYKLSPFCNGNPDNTINRWLLSGQIALILDGVDDIQSQEIRNKFFAEAKNYMINYDKCLIFITSRINRYHGELGNIKEYLLNGLSREIVNKQLREEGIHTNIPDSYYWLFSNPMFFNVGKAILKENNHNEIFNRSILFENLLLMLCGEWDKKKGTFTTHTVTCSEILNVLGNYAFETFNLPSYGLLAFDKFISKFSDGNNKNQITNAIVGSGIIKVDNKISFSHKLFKEYCAAYYIINSYSVYKNEYFYSQYIDNEEWKEVFIFASGMFKSIDEQDKYLDFVMEHNLALYVECINAKSDLSALLPEYKSIAYVDRYLRSILKSYTFIISKYFAPLKYDFDPEPGKAEKNISQKKVRIIGCISHNGEHLYYWFDRVTFDEPEVLCLRESQIAEYHKEHETQALKERKNIQSYYVNLKLSGLGGDSSRKVAIDRIKEKVSTILEKRQLIESKYILAERLKYCQKKVKNIKESNDLSCMYVTINQMITTAEEKATDLVAYDCNGVELYYLRSLLKVMIEAGIKYEECLLPKEDVGFTGTSAWVWELYSDDQKINRISDFFYFHQLSYIEMVQANFPLLYNKFFRYKDSPYQTVVLLYLKVDKPKDMYSEPSMLYYTIASNSDSIQPPQIRVFSNDQERSDYRKEIYNEIRQSYLSQGRGTHRLGYTQTGFTFTTSSNHYAYDSPLTDYIYNSIKSSLEEILGRF